MDPPVQHRAESLAATTCDVPAAPAVGQPSTLALTGCHATGHPPGSDPKQRWTLTGTMLWPSLRPPRRRSSTSRGAAAAYAVAWLVAAGVAVGVVFAIFGGADETVSLPPIREAELTDAVSNSRCQLQTDGRGERLNPPVNGPAGGRAAQPGIYDKPLAMAHLTAALRRGIIVIQFRPDLDTDVVKALKTLQAAVPKGTIVAPNGTSKRVDLTVLAYRRLLICPRFTTASLDAVRLFRGRFLGSGPDSS
jgi:Protein of unknown function (DUF3105)